MLEALSLIRNATSKQHAEPPSSARHNLIRSDSKLIVSQTKGEWKVEDQKLIPLNQKAKDLIRMLGNVRLEWVPRDQNYAGLWIEGKLRPLSVETIVF